ncbi:MAG: 16S rRNA (uracil(1498)-N(3))-methyltransferase [Acidobacteriota bacterium]|nr:16S rRNA (uracil(1498)-N(3))-methyltransferase [Acidobacteriota bacterium]
MRRRFFVEQFDEQRAVVQGDKARHLGVVLRAQAGQLYELSDGVRVRLGRVESVERDRVEFALLEELPANEPELQTTLLLSVVKFDSFEWAIEKATELGVTAIVPLAAARSEKGLLAAAVKRSERWQKIILEAAQQSRRVRLPVLEPATKPEVAFLNLKGRLGIFLSERAAAPPLREALETVTAAEAVLAVGPEGGWTDLEVESAVKAGFREASLGKLILRTETAVVAALASLSYALGE